jgi:hypothetical protein
MKKEVKYFDSHKARVKIEQMKKDAKKLSEMTKLIQSISESKEIKTVAELECWIQDKTGFKNIVFGADSLGIKDGYLRAKEMSQGISLVLQDLTPLYTLKKSVVATIEEQYRTYYSDEEIKVLKQINNVKTLFDELPYQYRMTLFINDEKNLINRAI